jgi:NAD(P)-dependent dehydrogenase (short-subunit alcohol dehydrogenase family)
MSGSGSVLVIGAQGALGRLCAGRLREAGFEVIRAGRRRETERDFRLVDLDVPDSVADACAGVDLVVTTIRHPGHVVERVVTRDGGTLLSVASLSLADRRELKEETTTAKGLVVLHAGVAPGIYSLIFKEMLADHPGADRLEIAATFAMLQTNGRAGVRDFAYPVLTSQPRHPTRMFEFRKPIGRRRCMRVAGPEVGFFGELADGRQADLYVGFLERWAQAELLTVNALGLWKRLPLAFFTAGTRWKAQRTTAEPRRDILAVTREDRRLAACAVEASGDYHTTAAATVMFAHAVIARRRADPAKAGIHGAEELFDLPELRDAIDRLMRIVPLQ